MGLIRAFPDDEWRALRVVVFLVGLVALAVAASGVFYKAIFHQPTTIKYLVTVIGFAFVTLLATVKAPLRLLVGVAIVVAPINAVITIQGAQLTPLLAVDLLAAIVALPRAAGGATALRSMAAAFVLLLVPGIAHGDSPGHWIIWLGLTVVTGWLTFEVAREPGGVRFVACMLLVTSLVQAAVAIYEFKTRHQLALYGTSGTSAASGETFFQYGHLLRPSGTLPDPIGLGQVLALCLPLVIAYAASIKHYALSFTVLCLAGVVALALGLSLSRTSILGGFVGMILTLLLLPGTQRLRLSGGVLLVGIAVTVVALGLGGSLLRARIESIFHPTAAHVSTASGDVQRVQIWKAALRTGEAHPVTGVGLGNVTKALPRYGVAVQASANAQNTPLQFFAEGGVLGLLAIFGVIASCLIDLVKAFRGQRLWVAGCLGALVATLFTWTTDVEVRFIQISSVVAILLGLVAAVRVASAQAPREPAR